jgi:hypothetical protein
MQTKTFRLSNTHSDRSERLARGGGAALVALALAACGNSGASSTSGAGGTGMAGGQGGTSGPGAAGSSGSAGTTGSAGSGSTGTGASGATGGLNGSDASVPVVGDGGGVLGCTPGVEQLVITDCGYPTTTTNPLTSTVFSENEVFRAIRPAGAWPNGVVQMFYNDEHAMTLGVREVAVKSSSGTTTTDYPITALATDPGSSTNPQTGTNMLVGDESGLDPSLRPMWPSLFISDISVDPNNRSGDWQQGGVPTAPNAIFGSWKAAVRTVDNTKTPSVVTITPDTDPAKNNWMLAGGDTPPSGLANQGYGAEARWNVQLAPGHSYRLQVLVHDGDQNKGGGDSGEACVLFCAGADSCTGSECNSSGTGGSGGTPQCPSGTTTCTSGGPDGPTCPSGSVCANGCCLPYIPIT